MASTVNMVVIDNMLDGGGNEISRVEVREVDGDDTCIQILDDEDPQAQSVWFDIEGAKLLRVFIDTWVGDR